MNWKIIISGLITMNYYNEQNLLSWPRNQIQTRDVKNDLNGKRIRQDCISKNYFFVNSCNWICVFQAFCFTISAVWSIIPNTGDHIKYLLIINKILTIEYFQPFHHLKIRSSHKAFSDDSSFFYSKRKNCS